MKRSPADSTQPCWRPKPSYPATGLTARPPTMRPAPSWRNTGRFVSSQVMSYPMPCSLAPGSRRSRHSRKGSTTSKLKGPSTMSMRSVPRAAWARTVVWRPRTLTMANASDVPRFG